MRKILPLLFLFFIKTSLILAFQAPKDLDAILDSSDGTPEMVKKINTLAGTLIASQKLNDAETAATKSLELAKTNNLETGKADALMNLGLIAHLRFDYTNAMNYFVEALRIKDATGDKMGIAIAKNNIGKVFFLQRNEENAVVNYEAALAVLEQAQAPMSNVAAEIHRNLGDLHVSKKIYGKAIAEFDLALKIWAENVQDLEKAASMASYLGKVASEYGDNDGAMTYYNASLNFHRNLNNPNGVADDFINLAKLSNVLNDKETATEYAENALSAFQQTNNQLGIANAYHLQAQIALKAGDRSSAEQNFEKSAEILRGVSPQPGVPELFKSIADGFGEMSIYPKAFAYLQTYTASKDSLFNHEKSSSLLELTTKYESQYAVKEKNRQLAVLEKEKNTEMMIRWLLIGLVACAAAAIFFVFKSYKQKKADNEKLRAMNTTIQLQSDEIAHKNVEMNVANAELYEKNEKLDHLNAQLVHEISARENSQKAIFNKDNYLANITVRMRQPLNDMVLITQALMNNKPNKEQRDHIQNLQYSTNNLLVLINDVLDFSEIEASKISLETVDFRPDDVMQEVKKELKATKDVRYEFNFDPRIPEHLKGDPTRLHQVMSYLLKNMRRDVKNGVFRINVLRNEVIDNEMTLKIDVQAEGSGINFKIVDSLFNQPANRESLETLNENDMQYVIVRRLVELQNGTIHAAQLKEDTVITIFLPFKVVEIVETSQNTEGVVPIYYNNFLEGKRILVVEDNKVNQMLVMNMLKKKGVLVTAANDGIEGLEALNKADFDLILMDIQMPRMDGYHAVAEIRRMKNLEKANLPIVALTASAYVTEKEKAQLFGMTDHIGKPFSPEEMLDKITRVLMSHKSGITESEKVLIPVMS
jgi:CheY-like chemotaxis protein/tetratricopeptide (TPR) repeat protein